MLSRRPQAAETSQGAPARPTFRSIAPDYFVMADRNAELERRAFEIEGELAKIVPKIRESGLYSSIETAARPPVPPPPAPDPKVVSLLGKLMPASKEKASPHRTELQELKDRAADLSRELDAIRAAQKLLVDPMRAAHLKGSADLCRALAPEYQIVADRVTAALLELGEATVEHDRWLDDLRRQGAAFSMLRPVLVQGPDDHSDPVARIRRLLEWASEAGGWFDADRIPLAWRKRA